MVIRTKKKEKRKKHKQLDRLMPDNNGMKVRKKNRFECASQLLVNVLVKTKSG
jgi:hypothetical protein